MNADRNQPDVVAPNPGESQKAAPESNEFVRVALERERVAAEREHIASERCALGVNRSYVG